VGTVCFLNGGETVLTVPVVATEGVEKAGFFDYFGAMAQALFR